MCRNTFHDGLPSDGTLTIIQDVPPWHSCLQQILQLPNSHNLSIFGWFSALGHSEERQKHCAHRPPRRPGAKRNSNREVALGGVPGGAENSNARKKLKDISERLGQKRHPAACKQVGFMPPAMGDLLAHSIQVGRPRSGRGGRCPTHKSGRRLVRPTGNNFFQLPSPLLLRMHDGQRYRKPSWARRRDAAARDRAEARAQLQRAQQVLDDAELERARARALTAEQHHVVRRREELPFAPPPGMPPGPPPWPTSWTASLIFIFLSLCGGCRPSNVSVHLCCPCSHSCTCPSYTCPSTTTSCPATSSSSDGYLPDQLHQLLQPAKCHTIVQHPQQEPSSHAP